MKKLIVTAGLLMCFGAVFAGGLLTNTNQSAQFIRMLSRNASTSTDAVYFNPAGLMQMSNGFYISLQSQTLFQTKTIESAYPLLNASTYKGETKVPVFPTAFAIYKMDKLAFSLGFGPNSGGGSAEFGTGIPYFEKSISKLVPGLAGLKALGQTVTNYKTNISFKGESVFWGVQAGVSYKINDIFSVYGGARYLPATNTYTGSITGIQVMANGTYAPAAAYLTSTVAPMMTVLAGQATTAAAGVAPLIAGGAGSLTLSTLLSAGKISAVQKAQIEGGLLSFGATQAQINAMPVSTIQATFTGAAADLNGKAATMVATGASLKDKSVDTKQTGSGITPILGLNIAPVEGLNIGVKYEFKTKLELTNATKVDDTGLFPDKATSQSDIPSILAIGVDYKMSKKFDLSVSFNSYNDKGVDWGNNIYGEPRAIKNNEWETAVGAQYQLCRYAAVSCGYMHTQMGVFDQFNSDFSFYSNSDTYSGGFEIKPTANFTVDLGALVTNYDNANKTLTDSDATIGQYTETYKKHNLGFAVGLSYHFGGK